MHCFKWSRLSYTIQGHTLGWCHLKRKEKENTGEVVRKWEMVGPFGRERLVIGKRPHGRWENFCPHLSYGNKGFHYIIICSACMFVLLLISIDVFYCITLFKKMKPHKWGQLRSHLTLPGKQASVWPPEGSQSRLPWLQLLSLRVGPNLDESVILTWMEVWGKKPFGRPEGMSDTGKAEYAF